MDVNEIKSGDFLKDVEIIITLRSGETDSKVLGNLKQAIVASVRNLLDVSDVVLVEEEIFIKTTSQGHLRKLTSKMYIK